MDKKKNSEDKQYYIPMEVNSDTIQDFDINPEDVEWTTLCNKRVRVIKVPVTKEQYDAYMRPMWREDKRRQRNSHKSLDELYEETELEFPGDDDVEESVLRVERYAALRDALEELEELDRIIMVLFSTDHSEAEIGKIVGMSQKGVNKRKHRTFEKLRIRLKKYR